jgi:hypothetical protein
MRQNTHPAFLTFRYRLLFLSAWLSRTPDKIHHIPGAKSGATRETGTFSKSNDRTLERRTWDFQVGNPIIGPMVVFVWWKSYGGMRMVAVLWWESYIGQLGAQVDSPASLPTEADRSARNVPVLSEILVHVVAAVLVIESGRFVRTRTTLIVSRVKTLPSLDAICPFTRHYPS